MARRVVLIGFPDFQLLDVTGPYEVFSQACRELRRRRRSAAGEPAYQVELTARVRGPLRSSAGLEVGVQRALAELRGPVDTLVVAGGRGVASALADRALLRRLRALAARSRRVASVCTGAFLLAEVGLLDGRRATTHWASCAELQARHSRIAVEADPIFVRDGRIWTSAGVTAGMDLALALVEEDWGRDLALMVARRMVLFLKRPGGQSQFSARLAAQQAAREPLTSLQEWIEDNPGADLGVENLARRVGLSPRHFARVFARCAGTTPARFVERTRVEAARRLLEDTGAGVEVIAAECGFGSPETLRRSFLRTLRVGPAEYRQRFRSAARGAREETNA